MIWSREKAHSQNGKRSHLRMALYSLAQRRFDMVVKRIRTAYSQSERDQARERSYSHFLTFYAIDIKEQLRIFFVRKNYIIMC